MSQEQSQARAGRVELRGDELLVEVVNQIIRDPSTWDQATWHCGTAHCVGGWCQIKGGLAQNDGRCQREATELLGLKQDDANWLFSSARTMSEIHGFAAAKISGKDFFADDGFDRAGFDRDGFNRAGFDRDGFDRAGFDRDGFDRAGFNRDGFDRAGFNRAGFNRAGFNRAGFNRAGFDRDGAQLPLLVLPKSGGVS